MKEKFNGIQGKLILLIVCLLIFTVLVTGYLAVKQLADYGQANTKNLENQIISRHKQRLKSLVDTVDSLVSHYQQKVKKGELSKEEAQRKALAEIEEMRYDQGGGYYWIHSIDNPQRPVMIMHPNKPELNGSDLSGITDFNVFEEIFYKNKIHQKEASVIKQNVETSNLFVEMNEVCAENGAGFVKYYWPKSGENVDGDVGYPKLSYVKSFASWDWVIGTGFYIDDVDREVAQATSLTQSKVRNSTIKIIVTAIVCLVLAIALAVLFSFKIVNPIKKMVNKAQTIAEGDLTAKIDIERDDEVGVLAEDFNIMVENLRKMVGEVGNTAKEVSGTSQELSASNQQVSSSIEEVANSVQEFSFNTDQVSETAQDMTEVIEEVNDLAHNGLEQMDTTQQEMEQILHSSEESKDTINELNEASEEIGNIVGVISDIAEQTNLLALNAAIEAARAGEQGKGFAVVADEIRELAAQTQNSASNIKDIIEKLIAKTEQAVTTISKNNSQVEVGAQKLNETGEAFRNITERIEGVVAQIQEMAATSEELSAGGEKISGAVDDQSNAMQQISDSAQELAGMAQELNDLIDQFDV